MPEDIIRNPRRPTNYEIDTTPEYKRLNIIPTKANPNLKPVNPFFALNQEIKEELAAFSAPPTQRDLHSFDDDFLDENIPYDLQNQNRQEQELDLGSAYTLPSNFIKKSPPPPVTNPLLYYPEEKSKQSNVTKDINPAIGEFILMVNNVVLLVGNLEEVEDRVRKLVYEEDPEFQNVKLKNEDIVILKRVNLQVGVFIREI